MNRATTANALAALAAVLGIVSIVTRPFLFAPIGLLVLLIAARSSRENRFTMPAAFMLSLGAIVGAAIAVGYTNPLY